MITYPPKQLITGYVDESIEELSSIYATLETPTTSQNMYGDYLLVFSRTTNSLVGNLTNNVTRLTAVGLPDQTCAVLITMNGYTLPETAPTGALSMNWDVSGTYTLLVIFDWGSVVQWDAYAVEVVA